MQLPSSPRPFRSRRRFPRIEVLDLIDGHRVPLDVPLSVRDLSQGGFSIESPVPFPPGTYHHFRFTTAKRHEVSLDATVIHCRLASAGPDGQFTYVTGFEFHSDESTDESVASLMDTMASVLSLE